ncbi:MAG: hypothetical protein CMM59_06080 [Rhodospirillaceae bacterium]|nr:hypothetical protein [Rhodospirillaceae bacterium]
MRMFVFFIAAISQILLYTVFRDWILDVPEAFARGPEDRAYLEGLVIFHIATVLIVAGVLIWRRRTA